MTLNPDAATEDAARERALTKLEAVSMEAGGVHLVNMADAQRFCQIIHKSQIAPASLDTPAKIFVALQTGAEAGLTPLASVRSIYVINGNPAWKGDAALALIRKHSACAGLEVGTRTTDDGTTTAFVKSQRKGEAERETTFTEEEANRAGLTTGRNKETYRRWLADMLVWRAVSRHAKRYWSDALLGLDIGEVVQTYDANANAATTKRTPPPQPDPLLAEARATKQQE